MLLFAAITKTIKHKFMKYASEGLQSFQAEALFGKNDDSIAVSHTEAPV
jgi:hypothetical protein